MEAISVALGAAAARLTLRLWTHGTPIESFGGDILAIFGDRVQDHFAQREVRRQFERMADQIADRLEPFLSVEVGGIAQNELEAAALAAQAALDRSDALDLDQLLAIDLDSADLARLIRRNDSAILRGAALSEAASGVYDTLISECASYITSIASQLPGYATREAQEVLGRQSRLAELAREIMESLPPSIVPREWGAGSEDQRFENKYRYAVREYAEQLQLFGVIANEVRRQYPLSVAYISMAVDEYHAGAKPPARRADEAFDDLDDALKSKGNESRKKSPETEDSDLLRVETLLADTDRLLLTGGAGSGKTTLIQWIALSAVAGSTSAAAPQDWQGRVPFIVPLRRFVTKSLPMPAQFVEQLAPNLAEAMPPAWVHRVLASGRGAVLIDGLDEIPQADREDARQWVLALVRDFPTNKFLVTSRTTAVTKGWREEQSFRQAELLPMEFGDIRAFIAHWHEATRQAVEGGARAEVSRAERSLLGIVRDRPPIRALCTSPLLCALICALHLQNASSLPNNRMDVYRTALEMLIHKRDNDRRVRVSPADIDFTERQILLRSFAAWLHENGAADATREEYDQRVARSMMQLHRVKSAPEEVASFMLERSGVLREPIAGRVDFVHRTFLEYLAASAFVDDNSIDKLVRLAHDDHWREVIILAAGHANSGQREQLIRGLLKRGAATPRRRHRLFLLAVACMETSPQLPSPLRKDLRDALREVLPPRNMTEATSVASAGELAVPLLEEYASHGVSVAAASVRALSLIGGESALRALEAYRADGRVTVARQLIRAWSSFDTEEYARRVLAHSPLDRGHITLTDTDQVAQLSNLPAAESVFVSFPRRFTSVRDLPTLPDSIYGADISGLEDVRSPADLPFSETIRSISVRNSSLENLAGIQRFRRLAFLSVSGNQRLVDIDDIRWCDNIRHLDLSGTSITDLALSPAAKIETLRLDSSRALERIAEPVGATSLLVGYAPALREIDGLRRSPALRKLYLQLAEARHVELPADINVVTLTSWAASLVVSGGESTTRLELHAAITPETLEWAITLQNLSYLSLVVRGDEIGGWSPKTAIAEVCARSAARAVRVSADYGRNAELPDPTGWTRQDATTFVWYHRDQPPSGG